MVWLHTAWCSGRQGMDSHGCPDADTDLGLVLYPGTALSFPETQRGYPQCGISERLWLRKSWVEFWS